jgi:hypothetical protein
MGAQTLNVSNLNLPASAFRCQKADNEWRAISQNNAGSYAGLYLHDALNPAEISTQCDLSGVSMYLSDSGIPGMRLDYDRCGIGPAKQATIMVGLRKVPDNYGATPGLADFFKQVCEPSTDNAQLQTRLRFDLIDTLTSNGCFAHSADMTFMKSNSNCFDPAVVFTFLDYNNHFPVFPVKDSEWSYFVEKVPKMGKPVVDGPIATTPSPCAPVVPPPPVYSHIIADRVCVAMPDLECSSTCGKFCEPVVPKNFTTTSYPFCRVCYDCEVDEIWYAVFGTILTFWLCSCCYSSSQTSSWFWSGMGKEYSPLVTAVENGAVNRPTWSRTTSAFGCMSLMMSFCSYYFINMVNYWIVVVLHKKEMCVKVWDFETALGGAASAYGSTHFSLGTGHSQYACYNDVCYFRMFGLIFCTWLSLWALFSYWFWHVQLETITVEAKREEVIVEAGGGGGAAMGGLCTVQ